MAKIRPKKVADLIKKELSQIIQYEVRDPKKGFVTLTHVRMTDDLSIAYVYFSVMGDKEQAEWSLQALTKASGFLRSQLGRFLKMRKMPQLKFFYDESLEYANKIEGLLHKIDKEEKPKTDDDTNE